MCVSRFSSSRFMEIRIARDALHDGFRRMAIGTMQAHKFFEPAVKDLFRTGQIIPFPLALLIEAREFDSRPEFILKRFGFARRCVKNTGPLDNNGPLLVIEKPIKINTSKFNQKASLQEQIKDIHVSHCLNSYNRLGKRTRLHFEWVNANNQNLCFIQQSILGVDNTLRENQRGATH